MAEKTAMAIINEFFGRKPGQTLTEFAAEIKELSPEEKAELVNGAAFELGHTLKPGT
jgi:hypothetical protein